MFHRKPFVAHFNAKGGNFDFLLVNIHTDPDEANEEIKSLPRTVTDSRKRFNESDIIILGDFNADCNYFNENTYKRIFPVTDYNWLIPNSQDTTVKGTICTYDRIVSTVSTNEDYAGTSGVYRFDAIHGLTQKQAAKVSDHYPVWAEFSINKDAD